MDIGNKNKLTEILFHISMWWRIIYGILRIIGAVLLLHHVGTPLSDIFLNVANHNPLHTPHEHLTKAINQVPFVVTNYLAFYFMFWGVIDVFLSIMLLRHKLWAFSITIYMVVSFIGYELYRLAHTHSKLLIVVIIMDICIVWIIRREYHKLRPNTTSDVLLVD